MSKLVLLYLTIVASLVFTLVPEGGRATFIFSDMVVSREYWIYSVYEFLILIVLTGLIVNEATEYRTALLIFFYLMIADLFDWIVCYNQVWFHVGSFPVSMNILKCIIFGSVISAIGIKTLYLWIRTLYK